jgi:hypothetical protein
LDVLREKPPPPPTPAHTHAQFIATGAAIPSGATELRAMAQSLSTIEQLPFDGLVVDVGAGDIALAPASVDALSAGADILLSIPFTRLSANFQRLRFTDVDLSDVAAWKALNGSAQAIAAQARRAGLRGLWFDPQNGQMFRLIAGPPPMDQEQQARARGHDFMQAIVSEFPSATIMSTMGFTVAFVDACLRGVPLAAGQFALLPAFLDGMLAAQSENLANARFIDGFLLSYPTRDPRDYRLYYDIIHFDWSSAQRDWQKGVVTYHFAYGTVDQTAGEYRWPDQPTDTCDSVDAAKLDRNLPAGFGIDLDFESWVRGPLRSDSAGAGTADFRPPEELERDLRAAAAVADGYVWFWAGARWWPAGDGSDTVPAIYLDAIARAHESTP